jgi:hypothetical protein
MMYNVGIMTLASRGEATALHRVLEEGLNETQVFKFPDSALAVASLVIGREKQVSMMAHNIVNVLGEAGCTSEVYIAYAEDGSSLTGYVYSPRVRVASRILDGETKPTNALRIAANDYTQLASYGLDDSR